jgi:hypothetical protein
MSGRKGIAKGFWNGLYTFEIMTEQHQKTNFKFFANTLVRLRFENGFKIRTSFNRHWEELAPREEGDAKVMIRVIERHENDVMRLVETHSRTKTV